MALDQGAHLFEAQRIPLLVPVKGTVHFPLVGKERVPAQIPLLPAHLKADAHAAVGIVRQILNLHHQVGAEILPLPVGGAVLLGAFQIGHHRPPVALIRRLVEEVLGKAAVEQDLDGVHHRGFSGTAHAGEQVHILVKLHHLMGNAAPVV